MSFLLHNDLYRYSWHLALLGTFLNLGIMFYLNGLYGVVACGLLILIFLLLLWIAPVVEWGDVSQAIIFHQVRIDRKSAKN